MLEHSIVSSGSHHPNSHYYVVTVILSNGGHNISTQPVSTRACIFPSSLIQALAVF